MQSPLGKNIRKFRRASDLTIEQLATAIGSQSAYVWKLENRTPKNPSRQKIQAIAKTLSITVEQLYSEENIYDFDNSEDKAYFDKFMKLDSDSKYKIKQIIDIFS